MTTPDPTSIEHFDRIMARFAMLCTDDLKPGVADFIGKAAYWDALWIIEDGPYAGRWAMMPHSPIETWPFAWTPDVDPETPPHDHARRPLAPL